MSGATYQEFVASKHRLAAPVGFDPIVLNENLFDFQRDLVRWACRRGRSALFCDTGLGKSLQSLSWAENVCLHTGGRVLILAPLAVANQTVREAGKFGIGGVAYARSDSATDARIVVTNYEMMHHFDVASYVGVVIDESSCLKAYDSKTRIAITESFASTPFRLACSATPAPNDFMELGNHSEFLSILTRAEMLATYFVHDGGETQKWRLKGHAEESFWEWMCSWGALVRKPSDLGYDDGAFELPPLHVHQHVIAASHTEALAMGKLFIDDARTLHEQRAARRSTIDARVAKAAELASDGEQWILWCDLNDEGNALARAIDGAVQVSGSDSLDEKEDRLLGFAAGKYRCLVTKGSIASQGLNFQNCARQAFVGVSHSWETWYQAIRRSLRFGQLRPVHIHVITSELEGPVVENLMRKEDEAKRMSGEMGARTKRYVRAAVSGARRELRAYHPTVPMDPLPPWLVSSPD